MTDVDRTIKILVLLPLLYLPLGSIGQSVNTYNYIQRTVYRQPFTAVPSAPTVEQVLRSVTYYDGLGRPIQEVQIRATPGADSDVIVPITYDAFGRQYRDYLPYADAGLAGAYRATAVTDQAVYYNTPPEGVVQILQVGNTTSSYSQTVFENSPLNRIQQQGAPGVAWQPHDGNIPGSGHTVKTEYGTNILDDVLLWQVKETGDGASAKTGTEDNYYLPGKLYKTIIKDENWISGKGGMVEEYKDFEDRIVLKRVWKSETEALNTYYVYDDFGDLRYVIPPGYTVMTIEDNSGGFNDFIYAYRYDERRRLIKKKIPGKGWEWIVYNANDQPVLTQDAVQRGKSTPEWSYTKYDAFGRLVSTGIYTDALLTDYADARAAVEAVSVLWESRTGTANYSNVAFPTSGAVAHVTNYYDDYSFAGASALLASGITESTQTKTLLTGMLVSRDDGTSPLLTVNYYDDRARLIQTASQNHLGGTDYVTNTYSFVGELLTSKREHNKPAPAANTITILTTNDYDHVGRLVETRKKVNSEPEIVQSRLSYNEIGQLIQRDLHVTGSTAMQEVAYRYNERGWLTRINDPQTIGESRRFGMALNYANKPDAFNGNIGSVSWNTKVSDLQTQTPVQSYTYDYDKLNRLELAAYSDASMTKDGFYDEELAYDDMGNITSLQRTNGGLSLYNNFTYSYTGNQLMGVTDAGTANRGSSFTYNANGNAITNSRLGITDIAYNYLNLPRKFKKGADELLYTYDATGKKLRKELGASVTDYADGIQYRDGDLEFIQTEEGRILPNGSSFIYEYFLKDHLGNTRAIVDHTGSVKQITDYYAFGMEMNAGNALNSASNRYKYNGKELQPELGLDQYDYGARFYDAEIGRWSVVDPMGEKFIYASPYNFVLNNPITNIDPDGREVIIRFNKQTGRLGIADLDHYKKGLPTKVVSAKDYVHGGIRDDKGNLTHNQILLLKNVFTGGRVEADGTITRDLERDKYEIAIPNGSYDLTEYEGGRGWYKVDPIDESRYDDHHQGYKNADGETRSGYRFHLGTISHGCITVCDPNGERKEEWNVVGKILENTSKKEVPKREGRQKYIPGTTRLKYGTINVTGTDRVKEIKKEEEQ